MTDHHRSEDIASKAVRILALFSWLWLLAAIPFLTDATCCFPIALLLGFSWCVLGAAWLCLPLVNRSAFTSRSWRRWYFAAASTGLFGLMLAFTDMGLIARVTLCEAWLNSYVADVPSGTSEFKHETRVVGLFGVDGTEEHEGVVLLYTSTGFLDRQGLAHAPPGSNAPSWVRLDRHLHGDWFHFVWSF
jgi:hypothetical protein